MHRAAKAFPEDEGASAGNTVHPLSSAPFAPLNTGQLGWWEGNRCSHMKGAALHFHRSWTGNFVYAYIYASHSNGFRTHDRASSQQQDEVSRISNEL